MKDRHYPALKWHPHTGESQVFNAAHEVPADWLDHHPASADAQKPAPKVNSDVLPMTRNEIVAELTAGAIPFKANQSNKALLELLDKSVREHLTSNNIDIPEGADVKALLALVPKQ